MSRIGIIGLGEAGSAIVVGLAEAGAEPIVGFDSRPSAELSVTLTPGVVELVGSLAELAERSAVIVNVTSAKAAWPIAAELAQHLTERHVYADLNSAGPAVKAQVDGIVAATGARFADVAIMAAVPPRGHRVPMLASGAGAAEFRTALSQFGADVEVIDGDAGSASAVKMFRSLLVKGLEALLLECVLGASSWGATERVFESMRDTLPSDDWGEIASYLLSRSVQHGDRRAEELRQVAATLADCGLEPLLAPAGARRLQTFADLDVREQLPGAGPWRYEAILAAAQGTLLRRGRGLTVRARGDVIATEPMRGSDGDDERGA